MAFLAAMSLLLVSLPHISGFGFKSVTIESRRGSPVSRRGVTMFGDEGHDSRSRVKLEVPPLRKGNLDSQFACEVDYGDDTVAFTSKRAAPRLCWDAEVTPKLALSIIEEATATMTVPAKTLTEALNRLRYDEEQELLRGAGGTDVAQLGGFWSLCFRTGGVLAEAAADAHGYLSLDDRVDLRLNVRERGVSLDTNVGFMSKTLSGDFSYSPAGDALEARFEQVKLGPFIMKREAAAFAYDLCRMPLRLRVFLATDKALGVVASFAGKSGVMLFRREASRTADSSRIQDNAAHHGKKIMRLARFDAARQKGATTAEASAAADAGAAVAEQNQNRLQAAAEQKPRNTRSPEEQEEAIRELMAQERQGFSQYFNEEAHKIFYVVAGPTLFSFFKLYMPIASWKAGVAATIIQQCLEQSV